MVMAKAKAKAGTASKKQPNILVIWGDDIGISNLSCYSHGLMGYKTPNIDRLANEGKGFPNGDGGNNCTPVRPSSCHGAQLSSAPFLSRWAIPSSPFGLGAKDPTIAELQKPLGYATG